MRDRWVMCAYWSRSSVMPKPRSSIGVLSFRGRYARSVTEEETPDLWPDVISVEPSIENTDNVIVTMRLGREFNEFEWVEYQAYAPEPEIPTFAIEKKRRRFTLDVPLEQARDAVVAVAGELADIQSKGKDRKRQVGFMRQRIQRDLNLKIVD